MKKEPLKEIVQAISGEKSPVWLVGGFVRDALLKRPTADVDVVVFGDAGAAASRFARVFGRKPFVLDEERGTHRVSVEASGQNVTVDFARARGKTLEADLATRDFTINAIALSPADWLAGRWDKTQDPTGGRAALKAREVRLVAERALEDDPLRLLRAHRLAAELDFRLTPSTARAVARRAKLLRRPAPERVREELMKTLATPRAADALRAMDKTKLLTALFPEGEPMRRTGKTYYGAGGVLHHSIDAVGALEEMLGRLKAYFPKFHKPLSAYLDAPVAGHPRFAQLKLVELFHDIGKPATAKVEKGKLHFYGHDAVGADMVRAIAARLRFSGQEGRSLTRMVGAHMRPGNLGHAPALTDRAVFRFYRDLEEDAVAMLIVALADHFTYLSEKVKRSRKDPVFLTIQKMLGAYFLKRDVVAPPRIIDGNRLMRALGVAPGPLVGRLLEAVREGQAEGKVRTSEEAVAWARRLRPGLEKSMKKAEGKP